MIAIGCSRMGLSNRQALVSCRSSTLGFLLCRCPPLVCFPRSCTHPSQSPSAHKPTEKALGKGPGTSTLPFGTSTLRFGAATLFGAATFFGAATLAWHGRPYHRERPPCFRYQLYATRLYSIYSSCVHYFLLFLVYALVAGAMPAESGS